MTHQRKYYPTPMEVLRAFRRGWDTQRMAEYWNITEAYCYNRLAEND